MRTYNFPLDHFGLVASHTIERLLKQDGDKRKRKTAFNELMKIAKLTKQIDATSTVKFIGLSVDSAGQIWLRFECKQTEQGKAADYQKELAVVRGAVNLIEATKQYDPIHFKGITVPELEFHNLEERIKELP